MVLGEWSCFAAVILVGALCYCAGWTERARWAAVAFVVLIAELLGLFTRDGFGCAAATVIVGVLCTFAGYFDRRR